MEYIAIFFILTTFIFLLTGFPVAFVLAGVSLIFAYLGIIFDIFDYSYLLAFPNRVYGIMINQNLLAVPLFIFMGSVLEKTDIAENLLKSMNELYKNSSSGLGVSVIIVGTFMAASTGIVGASVVTLGLLSLPVMLKNGYPSSLACGAVCASGTLGQIIPPSLVLILLADVLSAAYQQAQLNSGIFSPETITIGDLFAGAIIPGLLLPILYILYIKSKDKEIIHNSENIITTNVDINIFQSILPPIILIFLVLGSIIFGIATPSEAAGVGAAGALSIAFIQGKLTKNILKKTSRETIKITSMVFMILLGATLFSLVFRGFGGEVLIHALLIEIPEDKYISLLIVLVMMFFLGFILDFIEIIFIVIPLFGPTLFSLGFDPVWIGILIAMVLQTSFLTPPFGFSLFYLRGVTPKNISTSEIYKGVYPYIAIQIIVIIIIYFFPGMTTYLPEVLFN
ncbi:MAG: C4-dicarboxylate ABC transporter [Gammaproteobacteria bacterium]|nr:C4-dicarboxylate ABC transporter [Gammaproteobacteria bacterium]|tara:strand:- start:51575 stop:52933 length:1359 start_codon:yes stop_codon:yes gene_type:complete